MEIQMITNSKQNWTVGQSVKVGFLTLTVKAAIATPGDFAPDAYILVNDTGTQLYKFVPHNGLQKISADEVVDMLNAAELSASRAAIKAFESAKLAALNSAVFA
jgi:hypothetical protein